MDVDGAEEVAAPESVGADISMEVDAIDEAEIDASLLKTSSDIAPSVVDTQLEAKDDSVPSDNVIKEENGKLIVEKLDTPLIRKQRAKRRKTEKALAEAAAKQPRSASGIHEDLHVDASPVAGPSRLVEEPNENTDVEVVAGSDLSELSQIGSEEVRSQGPQRQPSGRTRVQPSRATRSRMERAPEPGSVLQSKEYEGGTLGMC
jgi:NuA3 HAT complex component NTO1